MLLWHSRPDRVRNLAFLLLLATALPLAAQEAEESAQPITVLGAPSFAGPPEEVLTYQWRIRGLLSGIAALFLPTSGRGTLTQHALADGHLVTELLITSPGATNGEYFYYGAELDPATATTLRAWSSYAWRGDTKGREADIAKSGVIDIASGILALRHDPPLKPRRLSIWSDGTLYPVVVVPLESEQRLVGSREVTARRYSIQGIDMPGKRHWKGALELWLADDEVGTPVEIVVDRGFARVQLILSP